MNILWAVTNMVLKHLGQGFNSNTEGQWRYDHLLALSILKDKHVLMAPADLHEQWKRSATRTPLCVFDQHIADLIADERLGSVIKVG
jgi:hypothetical protein